MNKIKNKTRFVSADDAVKIVESGDKVFMSMQIALIENNGCIIAKDIWN